MIGNLSEKEWAIWTATYAAHYNWQACRRYKRGGGWATDEVRDWEQIAEDAENAETIADAAVRGFRQVSE